jgi:hyperosmotically inducible protein
MPELNSNQRTNLKPNKGIQMKTRNALALTTIFAMAVTSIPLLAAPDDDRRVVSAAKQSYVYRTYLSDDHIKIQSKDGVVTLTGEVANRSHKSMAEDTVENLPGVKSVDNQLKVKSANEHSDGWLEVKVKSALLYRRSVSGSKTSVAVKDGIVTLTGDASSQAQKDLTEEYAKDIEGVKAVKNELKVSGEPPDRTVGEVIDDASITAQIKSALLTHRSTSAIKTKVTTRDGVVMVSGEASNQAEKDLVTKLVNDVKGVKRVVNNMDVKAKA